MLHIHTPDAHILQITLALLLSINGTFPCLHASVIPGVLQTKLICLAPGLNLPDIAAQYAKSAFDAVAKGQICNA